MQVALELKDLFMMGSVIVSVVYSIFKIEGNSKKNALLLKTLEEKEQIFLKSLDEKYLHKITEMEKKLELKREKIQELENKIKEHTDEFNKYLIETTKTFERMLDKSTADKRYVTKDELALKLNSIENKLDLLVSIFSSNETCKVKKDLTKKV